MSAWRPMLAAALGVLALGGCTKAGAPSRCADAGAASLALSIATRHGARPLCVEPAATSAAQERGLMYRTDLKLDGGMLFWPYPPDGGAPREATFWMKNTPSPLDILFLRTDGTVARIAENAVPLSETPIPSGEPVAAVLEIPGGRAAALGIAEGDRVTWPHAR